MQKARLIPSARSCSRAWCLLLGVAHAACSDLPNKPAATPEKPLERAVSYSLNIRNPTAEQRIGPDLRAPEKQKFVQIEITKIENPDKQAILFELSFKPQNQEPTFLGTFSPYPADKPGKFIVPTQGKLSPNGTLILSMVLPKTANATKPARPPEVQVAPFTFRDK